MALTKQMNPLVSFCDASNDRPVRFHKQFGNPSPAKWLLAIQEGFLEEVS